MDWCHSCCEPDWYGDGYCHNCDGPIYVAQPSPSAPVNEALAFEVEIFGVARADDGKTLNYIRDIASDERLAALKSMPYADYLESPEWWNVRMTALDAAGERCEVCNSEAALEVHHRSYTRLGAEVLEDLAVLCRDCHQRFHDLGGLEQGGSSPPARRLRLVFPAAIAR